MNWTLNLATELNDAPWPMTKAELIDYAVRSGCSEALVENLSELDDDDYAYESLDDIFTDIPTFGECLNLDDC